MMTTDLQPLLAIRQDPTTKKWVILYDSSLHAKSNCMQYVWNRLLQGLGTPTKDFKMEYGTAGHKALAHWYRGHRNVQECLQLALAHYMPIEVPASDWRDTAHLMNCLMQLFASLEQGDTLVPDSINGEILVEKNFAIPYHQTERTEVLLSGTMDLRGRYTGRRVVCDHKFTSMAYKPAQYLAKARISSQLMFYVICNRLMFPNEPVLGAILNGIFILKTNKNFFQRSEIVEFTEWQLRHHEQRIHKKVVDIVTAFEYLLDHPGCQSSEAFPPNFTQCPGEYGLCEYSDLCCLDTDADRRVVADMTFSRTVYDPLKFQQ